MSTWYVVKKTEFGLSRTVKVKPKAEDLVVEVEVERATDNSVWIDGKRTNRRSQYLNYFPDKDDAVEFMVSQIKALLDAAEEQCSRLVVDLVMTCDALGVEYMDDDMEDPLVDQFFAISREKSIFPEKCAMFLADVKGGFTTDMTSANWVDGEEVEDDPEKYDGLDMIPAREAIELSVTVLQSNRAKAMAKAIRDGR